jgi:hypothetical protein
VGYNAGLSRQRRGFDLRISRNYTLFYPYLSSLSLLREFTDLSVLSSLGKLSKLCGISLTAKLRPSKSMFWVRFPDAALFGPVTHLEEWCPCKAHAVGSTPIRSTHRPHHRIGPPWPAKWPDSPLKNLSKSQFRQQLPETLPDSPLTNPSKFATTSTGGGGETR